MFSKFSVKKPLTIFVGVIMVILLGFISFTSMKTDLLPKLVYPAIVSNIFIPINAFDFLLDNTNNEEKIKHIKSFILKGIKNE